jgi:hypothetical protein
MWEILVCLHSAKAFLLGGQDKTEQNNHIDWCNEMNKVLDSFPHLAVILFIGFPGLVITVGCSDSTGPDFCWMSVDTLYTSGISIHDTSDVRAAFEAYIVFIDTTDAEFPSELDWTYLTSRPFDTWRGRFYWQVDHEAYSTSLGKRVTRRLVYVDENGVVVWPFGCI